MENEKKLTRSSNRMIAGVCAGIAEYFLYEKQDRDYLCEWKRVSIPFYIFFPCTTA